MKKRIMASILILCMGVTALTACRKIDKEEEPTTVDYSENVTLGDYTGFDITVKAADVTDDQVQSQIDSIIKSKTEPEKITDRVVAATDTVNMDFTGYIDDKAFDNGSAKGYDYAIGGNFIKDLNDQLIGLSVGQEYSLNCTFPDDYAPNGDTSLAGKDCVFKVTINYIHGKDIVPEWNDDFVNSYSDGKYTTTDDYDSYLREQILEKNKTTQQQDYEQGIIEQLYKNSKVSDTPQDLIDTEYDSCYNYYKNYYTQMASYYGTTYDQLLSLSGMKEEDLQAECKKQAEYSAAIRMIITLIAVKEDISISNDEYESKAQGYLETYSVDSIDKLEDTYGKTEIQYSFLYEKVMEYLTDNNNMVIGDPSEEETTAEEETTTAAAN